MARVERCQGEKSGGDPCRAYAVTGTGYCVHHQDQGNLPELGTEKYTVAQVVAAIEGSQGVVSAVAESLGCSRSSIYRYRDRYEEVAEALEEEREALLDLAESRLFNKAIVQGDNTALIFLLKTQGKRRGYIERVESEVFGPDGGPIPHQVQVSLVAPDGTARPVGRALPPAEED